MFVLQPHLQPCSIHLSLGSHLFTTPLALFVRDIASSAFLLTFFSCVISSYEFRNKFIAISRPNKSSSSQSSQQPSSASTSGGGGRTSSSPSLNPLSYGAAYKLQAFLEQLARTDNLLTYLATLKTTTNQVS